MRVYGLIVVMSALGAACAQGDDTTDASEGAVTRAATPEITIEHGEHHPAILANGCEPHGRGAHDGQRRPAPWYGFHWCVIGAATRGSRGPGPLSARSVTSS